MLVVGLGTAVFDSLDLLVKGKGGLSRASFFDT